jgi:hypothetical protein
MRFNCLFDIGNQVAIFGGFALGVNRPFKRNLQDDFFGFGQFSTSPLDFSISFKAAQRASAVNRLRALAHDRHFHLGASLPGQFDSGRDCLANDPP